ncbi:MAG TPA: heme ABC exporter ATP-binding protein CcmA [Gemmatimonadales bacterium]|nr:heme ABC exporter ATP-binding protein CcmA [Gemmatimonadales bacterium]HRZ08351.1 heme ABC exporter ATP-binding protein CcmA [Gemmatimonadales bacterium]
MTEPVDPPLLSARGLVRAFGALQVLRGVDLDVRAGEMLAVAGPNGAGKTTLLRLLAGLMRPSAGEVRIRGQRPTRDDPGPRRAIGLLSHHTFLYDDLTPAENLHFTARLYGLTDPAGATRAALEEVGLTARADTPVRHLSRGLLQRAAIARALLHQPDILLLDEPFTGLDAPSADRFRALLAAQLARGRALVLVSHHLAEAWDLATHVAVLSGGRWALEGSRPSDLAAFHARYAELVHG